MTKLTAVIVRNFKVNALIGIYPQEHITPQRITVNVTMHLRNADIPKDRIEDTVSYEGIVSEIRRLAAQHHNLVETLAETLAQYALKDMRVASAVVEILKDEIFPEGSVGCHITRTAYNQ